MLEFAPAQSAVIRCFAEPGALDALRTPVGAFACRIAPDELVFVSARDATTEIRAVVSADLERTDPDCLVLDQSDGWAVWMLSGPDRARAFARLCTTPYPHPPAFLQGAIGSVPAKAVVLSDRIYVMVSSSLGHHIRERILAACGDLTPRAGPAAPLALGDQGRTA